MKVPIAVFAYNRADRLSETLEALAQCEDFVGRNVHIFCDAPLGDSDAAVEATCSVAAAWCARHHARLVRRERNLHFRNITEGLSELTESEGTVISLEDDHVPARHLLAFLTRGLTHYAADERVFQIAGYLPGVPPARPATAQTPASCEPPTAFLPVPMPTGWATWHRAWRCFRWQIAADSWPLAAPRRLEFDLGGAYPAGKLMERALAGDFASYFIRWYLAMFRAGGLALCSTTALVLNRGLASGVHARPESNERRAFFNGRWRGAEVDASSWEFPSDIRVDEVVLANFVTALREHQGASRINPSSIR